ncbi:hypothetical protein OUZ56_017089 [Daphnia magna]|nr:hypothetical protein OUZ56_017089 [Daphnia magna]
MYAALTYFIEALNSEVLLFTLPQAISSLQLPTTPQQKQPKSYGEVLGNTNKGSSYWVSPEGQIFTLTWAADEAGFQLKGDHLPVAPVHEY